MFQGVATLWREARGTRLKAELLDAIGRLSTLREADAERFGRGLSGAYNIWLEKNGPVKGCSESFRKQMAREFVNFAKERYGHDIGLSYAWILFSFHVESSFLPGEDAAFVHSLTKKYIITANEMTKNIGSS